jgi:hypothetical protein
MTRLFPLLILLVVAAACQRPAAAPPVAADTMEALLARLDAKCGETPAEMDSLIRHGGERLRTERDIPIQDDLFAVVLDNSLPPGERRPTCAPKVDTLVLTIMR